MTEKEMVQLNNKKRKLLTPENEAAYGDMLIYLRLTSVPQKQMEELLLEILDHLLEAQEDGKTAHDIFGEDLKAYCDELINSSEHQNSFQQAAVIGFAVSLLLAVQIGYDTFTTLMQKLFSNTNTSGIPFSIPGTILSAIVLTIGAFITFSLFRRFSFTILVSWKQKALLLLSVFIPFVLSVFANVFFKTKPYLFYNLSILQGALITLSFYILYKFLYKTSKF
ncbi:TPA: DUF1048 domain-containing protein [Bacillus thuringiensis]|uniref:DUF1048 domain-containing protein n=10 Tax=Bacillus cereus group TaxID=86661 RepID=A0A9X6KJJ5_BACTU|nr:MULTISPECIES: DUF1129 family protein [Bacillus]ANN34033.1 hypothetical protein A9498_22085 [Bacillus thuringiensis serovar coreanensis]MDM5372083.1 DUF1129 family protein [Bacillus bombysepticus]NIE94123.1 DUF1048 domain-containing protein [Bacillus sp. Ab-1751]CKH07199.1 Uncharacterized protein conserved in bacteria [Streptococcus pneumoniae]AGE80089.1 hypothetical protein HD73_4511 [Bacillus thuringiensis serovar kurstaki str. HD73]